MKDKKVHFGIDIGGTNIKYGIVSDSGMIIFQDSVSSETGFLHITNIVKQSIKELLQKISIENYIPESIGIGIPGTTDPVTGHIFFAPNLFLKDVNIAEEIKREFELPVYCTQDSRAAAWGEYMAHKETEIKNLVSITLGTGIGCGIIINGKIFHGGLNTAGEFGHQIIELNGKQCNCGKKGCLEAYIGGPVIVKNATESMPDLSDNWTVEKLFTEALSGSNNALKIINEVIEKLGIGLTNMINLFSPELITLSGGISNANDELLLNPLTDFVKENCYSVIADKIQIKRSVLGSNSPLVGAALLHKELVSTQEQMIIE